MGYMRVKCKACRGRWEVYPAQINSDTASTCPHCGATVDRQTWERQIMPAFGQLEDANRELVKDFIGYAGQTLFTVDYISSPFYKGAKSN